MTKESVLQNNLEFMKVVVGMAVDGQNEETKSSAREFVSRLNKGAIELVPVTNSLRIKSILSPNADRLLVFVPYPFSDFVGDQNPARMVEYGIARAVSYSDSPAK